MNSLVLLLGPDRCGKSTYAKKLAYRPAQIFHWGIPSRDQPHPLYRFETLFNANCDVVSDRGWLEFAFQDRVLCNITYPPDYVASEISRFENKLRKYFDVGIVVLQRDWDAEMVKRHQTELDQTNYAPWFKDAQMRHRKWLRNEFYRELHTMLSYTIFPYEVRNI